MSSHAKLTGKHQYVEFKEETIQGRVKKMVEMRSEVDVENAHVKFSYGNRKTGNLVPSVSLIPIIDCGANCTCCAKGCYAIRNICCYSASRAAFANNSAIARRDPEKFFREVDGEMKKNKWFRFFVSGDILSGDFFDGMVEVSKRNPHCQVLAFTKQFDIVNRWIDYNGELPETCTLSSLSGAGWMFPTRTTFRHRGRYGRESLCRAAYGAAAIAQPVP